MAVLTLLPACSPTATASAAKTPAAQAASQVIGPKGGSLTYKAPSGAQFELVVPAGALADDVTLTMQNQPTVTGQRFNVAISPKGLTFKDGQRVLVQITLPAGQTATASDGAIYNSSPIVLKHLADGRLQVSLARLAGESNLPANTQLGALSSSACAVPVLQTQGGLSMTNILDVELYGQCMVDAINNMLINELFIDAVKASEATAAYVCSGGLFIEGSGRATTLPLVHHL